MRSDIERQELYCHGCGNYVQFDVDMSLNGNHELTCPVCGHIHYRVVQNGRITEERWRSSMQTYTVSAYSITYTTASTYDTSTSSSPFLYESWLNATTAAS